MDHFLGLWTLSAREEYCNVPSEINATEDADADSAICVYVMHTVIASVPSQFVLETQFIAPRYTRVQIYMYVCICIYIYIHV